MVMTVHYATGSRILSVLFPLAFSVLLSGCAGLNPKEQQGGMFDVQLNPECCEGISVTPKPEGVAPGGAAAEMEALEQPAARRERGTFNQVGRLPGPTAAAKQLPATDEQNGAVVQGTPTDKLVLNYEQADLRVVVEELADILGINLLISTPIAGAVTFKTDAESSLMRRDIWPLFRLLLSNGGLSLVRRADFYEVIPGTGDALDGITMQGAEGKSLTPLVTQITPLKFIEAANAIELLAPILEGNGRVATANNINMLAITGSKDRLDKINQLLPLVDIDPFQHRGIRLFYLQNADAELVAGELDSILEMIEGNRGTYQVHGLKRINALLVVSSPQRGFKAVERWVKILDEAGSTQSEQMFVYRMKSLNAVSMAETLSEIFGQESEVALPLLKETQLSGSGKQRLSTQTSSKVPGLEKVEETPTEAARAQAPSAGEETTQIQRSITGPGVSADLKLVIVANEETNSLLVRATPRDYRQLLTTLSHLDRPPLEVVISVIIAQVTLNDSTNFGIDWKTVWSNATSFIGTGFGVPNALTSTGGSAVGLVFNDISRGGDLTVVLNALASTNKVDVLSRPTILVKNNQEASIKVGSQQPVITAQKSTTDSGANPVVANDISYRDTGIELTVKPQINDDGIIQLEIDQALSSIGQTTAVEGSPSFDNQQISTVAVVADRSLIMIGGLIENGTTNKEEYVPFLGAIPVVGAAFGTTSTKTVRRELVLMIVPEVVDPSGGEAYYKEFRKRVQYAAAVLESSFSTEPWKPMSMPKKLERILVPDR
ncbi:MAG: type II secretion system secretin GspD [Gammaproteobacteria bacterium]|nr:type II secretion system secretin GspD [Gammaproteobacteria bacterium]